VVSRDLVQALPSLLMLISAARIKCAQHGLSPDETRKTKAEIVLQLAAGRIAPKGLGRSQLSWAARSSEMTCSATETTAGMANSTDCTRLLVLVVAFGAVLEVLEVAVACAGIASTWQQARINRLRCLKRQQRQTT